MFLKKVKGIFGNYLQEHIFVFQNKKKKKNLKTGLTIGNYFLFSAFRNRKHGVFIDNIFQLFLVIFTCFFRVVLKNNYTNIYIG